MPASWELITLKGISKQSWLTADEQDRFKTVLRQWTKENPNATTPQIHLVELLVRNHLMIQRLFSKRYFMDGSRVTSYTATEGHKTSEIDEEDAKRKAREFDHWYPILTSIETKLLQLALANSIEVNVTNDISSLFSAIDAQNGTRTAYRMNGKT